MDITILDITFISFIIILGLFWYKVINTKKKMEKTEKALESEQFLPECGDISHGMVITDICNSVKQRTDKQDKISKED